MTSMIKKAIPAATVGLLLLAGSPAFAARYDTHHERRQEELIVPNRAKHQLPFFSWSGSDNSSPYIDHWQEGYPRSTAG